MISTKPLTTTHLNLMLKNFDIFMGTFPSDQIQIQKRCYPQAFIVNTEPSTSVGEHWTALIVSDKKCLFFDPLGCEMLNVFLLETLKSVGITKYKYNSCQIQSIFSNNCGYYCVAFILSFIKGFSYSSFIHNFVSELKQNDRLCILFIEKHLNKQ